MDEIFRDLQRLQRYGEMRTLNSVTWNNAAFPGGSWPQATAQRGV